VRRLCSVLIPLLVVLGCGGGAVTQTSDGGAEDSLRPACVPEACPDDGKTCGTISDGCGGISECAHTCELPFKCGALFQNICGCIPKSMDAACTNVSCGFASDGCGDYLLCSPGDITTCPTCMEDDKDLTCIPPYHPYKCAGSVLPLGCFEVGLTSYWCCQYLG